MRDPRFYLNKFLLEMSKKHHWSSCFMGDPMVLELEVTTYCNAKCIQCSRQGEYLAELDLNRHLPYEDFIRIIKKFPYLERITFSGMGEPLLYPHIFKAIEHVKKVRKGAIIAISTNSGLFKDPKMIDNIVQSKLDILQISWHGASEDTIEKIMGIRDFNKIIAGTKELINKKPRSLRVFINCVLMRENADELDEIIRLVSSVGIKSIAFNRRNYISYSKTEKNDAAFYDSLELASKIERARTLAGKLGIGLFYDPKPKCNSLWDYSYVSLNGDVSPCGAYDMPNICNLGNIFTDGKQKIYRSAFLRSLRRDIAARKKPEYCKNCYLTWA